MSESHTSDKTKQSAPVLVLFASALILAPLCILLCSVGTGMLHAESAATSATSAAVMQTPRIAVDILAANPIDPAFATCVACHGADGAGQKALMAPRLAGQADWYVKDQLTKFRSGLRGAHPQDVAGAMMAPMAKMLADDAAVDAAVAAVATLSTDKPADTIEGGDIEKGKAIYAGCVACHGQKGEGMQMMKAPRLQGQHGWYIQKQLVNFKTGIRGGDATDPQPMLMSMMAKQFVPQDQDVLDVIAYIQTLEE